MRRLLSAFALIFISGSAHAGFVTVSQTNIGVGQSVTLDFSGVPNPPPITSYDDLIPPGGSLSIGADDALRQTIQRVTAPGSQEGNFFFNVCSGFPNGCAYDNTPGSFSGQLSFT